MGLCRILLLPGPCAEVHGPSLKGIYTGIWVLMRLQVKISLSSSPLEVLIHPSCALKAPPQLTSSGLSNTFHQLLHLFCSSFFQDILCTSSALLLSLLIHTFPHYSILHFSTLLVISQLHQLLLSFISF